METNDTVSDADLGRVVPPTELQDDLLHDNFGPSVEACVWSLAMLAFGWLVLRLYLKLKNHRGLWWDDHFLTIVSSFHIILSSTQGTVIIRIKVVGRKNMREPPKHSSIVLTQTSFQVCVILSNASASVAISLGWGKQPYDIVPKNWPPILLALSISGLFSILAAVISKTSFALTLLRISGGWVKCTVWFAIFTINAVMGLSIVFNWVQCTPVEKIFNAFVPGSCWPRQTLIQYNVFAAGTCFLQWSAAQANSLYFCQAIQGLWMFCWRFYLVRSSGR